MKIHLTSYIWYMAMKILVFEINCFKDLKSQALCTAVGTGNLEGLQILGLAYLEGNCATFIDKTLYLVNLDSCFKLNQVQFCDGNIDKVMHYMLLLHTYLAFIILA